MNKFHVLIFAAVGLSLAAWFVSQHQQQQFSLEAGSPLLADFDSQLAKIDKISITSAGVAGSITLSTDGSVDKGWQVAERGDYPADMSQLRQALRELADAKRVEAKTALPGNYAQLGVQDVDLAKDTTLHLQAEAGDSSVLDILIGKTGRSGNYVRLAGDPQSWLIDKRINLPRNASAYLDKKLLEIDRQAVKRVAVTPLQGAAYSIQNNDLKTADFDLDPPPPQGREVNIANVSRLSAALSNLRLNDVLASAPEGLSWSQAELSRADGLVIKLELAKGEANNRYLRMQADHVAPPAEVAPTTEPQPNTASDAAADADTTPKAEPPDPAAVKAEVARLNALSTGRIFMVPQYSADALAMTHEMMLKPLPAEDDGGDELN